jgi:hypothetical protein
MVLVMTGRPPAVVASPGPSENPHGGSGRLRDPRRRSNEVSRCPHGHRAVSRSPTWSPPSRARIAELETETFPGRRALAWSPGGLRARAEGFQLRDHAVSGGDQLVGAGALALLEAPPVTSRIPDMARHDMARADPLAQSMRSLLEAAQQAARPVTPRPVTPRTWREMIWSERWRWLRRTG